MKDQRQLTDFTGSEAKEDKPSVIAQFVASMGKEKPSLEQQLASAKAEIAEYRKFINVISILADNVDIICKADELLAKHKGE